ncbi:hypothetical protein CA235_07295 [Sphingomonas sp. ABOLF]|uniref:hypothetical protein n=1 Tax=Sphingomonas sp. ABOLF TaxID=1985879 RepID=UPI000F7E2145|nr:hypothetical protein [Sphingomonas sp. ABOLF]RSV15651.1 hypothetical protein CA235_07295 [Sphingomonas sp. ABOLF]
MSEIRVGQFVLIKGYSDGLFHPGSHQVEQVTAKLVRYTSFGTRQTPKADVIAAFDSRDDAEALKSKLAGIAGERDRRINAARLSALDAARAAIAAATGGAA